MNHSDYMKLAAKYEDNEEVKTLVVLTYEGTKAAYLLKGFLKGMTFGMLLSLAIALFVFSYL